MVPNPIRPRVHDRFRDLVRARPLTLGVVLACVLVSGASALLGNPDVLGFGLPALRAGAWWRFALGAFATPTLPLLPLLLAALALVTGALEGRLGSRWTASTLAVTHLAGTVGAATVLLVGQALPWPWAHGLASVTDSGPSAAGLGALAVLTGTMRPSARNLVVTTVSAYLLVAVLCSGLLWDLEHLLAWGTGLLLAGSRRRPPTSPLVRLRVAAALLVVMAAAVGVVQAWFPGYGGVLGAGERVGASASVPALVVLLGALVLGDGLRRGSTWAWRLTTAGAALSLLAWPLGAGWSAGTVACLAGALGLGLAHRREVRAASSGGADGPRGDSDVRSQLLRHGGGSLGWQHTWADHESWTSPQGVTLGFRRSAGVAIVLADPIGPRFAWDAACRAFVEQCRGHGLVVAWYAASADLVREHGLEDRSLRVGEDAVVDLPGLTLTGRDWQDVRTARNRAAREQVTMHRMRHAEEPALVGQVSAISTAWAEAKPLPELGFTLGSLREALDPEVRVHVATDADGRVHGVVSWLPVHRDGEVVGWTLDLMRRAADGFRPTMEFLIAESLLAFRDEGYETASLSVAPLARDGEPRGPLERLLARCGGVLEPVYGFSSLLAFKRKFSPRLSPVHLGYESVLDLPRIAVAITRAHLPSVTLRELGRAAWTLGAGRRR